MELFLRIYQLSVHTKTEVKWVISFAGDGHKTIKSNTLNHFGANTAQQQAAE